MAINIITNAITIIRKKPSRKLVLIDESFAIVFNLLQYKQIRGQNL